MVLLSQKLHSIPRFKLEDINFPRIFELKIWLHQIEGDRIQRDLNWRNTYNYINPYRYIDRVIFIFYIIYNISHPAWLPHCCTGWSHSSRRSPWSSPPCPSRGSRTPRGTCCPWWSSPSLSPPRLRHYIYIYIIYIIHIIPILVNTLYAVVWSDQLVN